MLNRYARAFFTKLLTPVAKVLIRLGISPDVVTVIGTLGVCFGALAFYPRGELLVGTLVTVSRHAVDLVKKDDRTLLLRGLFEESPKDLFALAIPLAEHLWAADLVEARVRLAGNDSRKHRLTGPRWTGEQHTFDCARSDLG